MVNKSLVTAVALSVTLSVSAQETAIPVVPVGVMKKAALEATERKQSINAMNDQSTANISSEAVITMTPGVNQIIPISIGHPNRIVTPFGNPEVVSTSLTGGSSEGECGEVCIKDNVIYVATNKEHPVTMFITEQGSEARALSLTMVPRKVPPREVFLKLDDLTIAAGYVSNPKAERWERSKPYIETIRTVFRNLALGEVPTGYNISSIPNTIVLPSCNQPGMDVSFSGGQLMTGHSLSVFVGVAENLTSQPQEFIEASCGNWDVAAVSTWPLKVLEPGQRTEVYVAQKQVRDRTSSSKRPSLLGGRK